MLNILNMNFGLECKVHTKGLFYDTQPTQKALFDPFNIFLLSNSWELKKLAG